MAARFPYLPVASGRGDASLMPVVPLELRFKEGGLVQAHGLLDSGATVNVLPYGLGVRLGAVWEAQITGVTLAGNLAAQEARALLVQARVGDFAPVPLVFAWTRAENVPLLLGQVNFFEEFDVCFQRARRRSTLSLRANDCLGECAGCVNDQLHARQFEEFAPLVAWWDQPGPGTKREENERAWKVPAAELLANGCNLDRKNPRAKEDITHLPPAQLAESILEKERRIAEILGTIKGLLAQTK